MPDPGGARRRARRQMPTARSVPVIGSAYLLELSILAVERDVMPTHAPRLPPLLQGGVVQLARVLKARRQSVRLLRGRPQQEPIVSVHLRRVSIFGAGNGLGGVRALAGATCITDHTVRV